MISVRKRSSSRSTGWVALALVTMIVAVFGTVSVAGASESPSGCTANDFIMQVEANPAPPYSVGETIEYTVKAGNQPPPSAGCDATDVGITLTTPDGVVHVLQDAGEYPFTSLVDPVGTPIDYTVDMADAVPGPCGNVFVCPQVVATATADGYLKDNVAQDDPFSFDKQLSGEITWTQHYLCWELRTVRANNSFSTVDQFGTASSKLKVLHQLCNPVDKNDEDPNAPSSPDHLTGYNPRSQLTDAFGHRVQATNQFGDATLGLGPTSMLFVPAAKSTTGPPGPLGPTTLDHFICYTPSTAGGFKAIKNVKVRDQFGTFHIDLVAIRMFCDPANVNGNEPGADTHVVHLTCYRAKPTAGTTIKMKPKPFINDEFMAKQVSLDGHVSMLCVPSLKTVLS